MKTFNILVLATMLLAIVSCQSKEEDKTTLSGIIENPVNDFVLLSYNDQIDTAYLDTSGHFTFYPNIEKASYCKFVHGDEQVLMYMLPLDNIQLSLDYQEFDESLIYEGSGAVANNYLIAAFLEHEKQEKSYVEQYSPGEDTFVQNMDAAKAALSKLYEESEAQLASNTAYADFLTTEKAKIDFSYATQMLNYESYHRYVSHNNSFKVSENFYSFINDLDLDNEALLDVNEFTDFLQSYLQFKSNEKIKEDSTLEKIENYWYILPMQLAPELFNNEKIVEYLEYSIFKDQVYYSGIKNTEKMQELFNQYVSNVEYKNEIDSIIKIWDKVAVGKDAPDFTFTDIEGNSYSLSDFKGKIVYIDVWATWCGPCRMEIPYLEKIEDELSGENIQFISVSIDDDKGAWEKWMNEKETKGLQLYAPGWQSSICQDWFIHSIPRFLLIGADGKIIDNNADRPSGNIKDQLLELLSEIEV